MINHQYFVLGEKKVSFKQILRLMYSMYQQFQCASAMFNFFGTEMDFEGESCLSFELEKRCQTKKNSS